MSANRFSPRLESLDQRIVPTVIPTLVPNPTGMELVLTGDASNDDALITDLGDGTVKVTANGGANDWVFEKINKITVNAHAGHDRVQYALVGSLQSGRTQDVRVDLGTGKSSGNDSFAATVKTGVAIEKGARLSIIARGGDGADSLSMTAIDVDVAPAARLTTSFQGGAGRDSISQVYRGGDVDGTLVFLSYGNEGDDAIRQIIHLDPKSTGEVGGRVIGEQGNDSLTFFLTSPPSASVLAAQIIGGAGTDTLNHTPNVTATP